MEQDESHFTSSSPPSTYEETPDWPLNNSCTLATEDDKRERRKSLRVRATTQVLNNAEPPSPLNFSLRSAPLPKTSSRMSLFTLFSKPKVERQRGYTERDLDLPPPPSPGNEVMSSSPNIALIPQSNQPIHDSSLHPPQTAATTKFTPTTRNKDSMKPSPQQRKTGSIEALPLFQAYPQSMRDGILEVSTIQMLQKSKHKRSEPQSVEGSQEERPNSDSNKRGHKTSSHIDVDLPRKEFILTTSGHLLQYAETGSSDRPPEKILHLGKDSAAFACDLVAGKHHVLQVSQAVSQDGVALAHSASIFSKLGIRSTAARRMTSSFVLVMPNAREMGLWMKAIRREIEKLGGKKIMPDPTEAVDGSKTNELSKSPSLHRFQVKRNPSKVSHVTSVATPAVAASSVPVPRPPSPGAGEDKSDTATIDGIEMEASKLDEDDEKDVNAHTREVSDAPSMTSSAAVSPEQQQLNGIRGSGTNSARTSHTSQVGASPGLLSQVSPLVGSPPSEHALNAAADPPVPLKSPFRSMLAQGTGLRRSGVALPTPVEGKTLETSPNFTTSPTKLQRSAIDQCPVVAPIAELPATTSPRKTLGTARSEPNLHRTSSGNDSMSPGNPDATSAARPDSFVGDLPPPSTWSSSRSPSRRTSLNQSSSTPTSPPKEQRASPRTSVNQPLYAQASPIPPQQPQTATRTHEINRGSRISFSMPLKVNPSGAYANPRSSVNNRRTSWVSDSPDATAANTPIVHAMTATLDASNRISIQPAIPNLSAITEKPPSSFPAPQARPQPQRSFSAIGETPHAQLQAQKQTPRRPNSLQVHAPDARAIPIRGMKPSRSATNVPALATTPTSSPLEAFRFEDAAAPLPALRPHRGLKGRSSLPELDFGMPVVGLGPPAPPPDAPLPLPPSPTRLPEGVHGLGIRVS